jgi:CheY-like chemotaxis protein
MGEGTFTTQPVVLIDDSPAFTRLVQAAFEISGIGSPLVVFHDPDEALSELRGWSRRNPPRVPLVILLDIEIPYKNGLVVLSEIRSDPCLKSHRVVLFSGSIRFLKEADLFGADGLAEKPLDLDSLIEVLKRNLSAARTGSGQ